MRIVQKKLGVLKNLNYLVVCEETQKAILIDAARGVTGMMRTAVEEGIEIEGVILTHTHFDHVWGLKALLKAYPQLKVYVHVAEMSVTIGLPFTNLAAFCQPTALHNGDMVEVGNCQLTVIHTPGHTPGGICLLSAGNIFTGDTLFVNLRGRTDLLLSDEAAMKESLRKIFLLPTATLVWPGHSYLPDGWCDRREDGFISTTIGRERNLHEV